MGVGVAPGAAPEEDTRFQIGVSNNFPRFGGVACSAEGGAAASAGGAGVFLRGCPAPLERFPITSANSPYLLTGAAAGAGVVFRAVNFSGPWIPDAPLLLPPPPGRVQPCRCCSIQHCNLVKVWEKHGGIKSAGPSVPGLPHLWWSSPRCISSLGHPPQWQMPLPLLPSRNQLGVKDDSSAPMGCR